MYRTVPKKNDYSVLLPVGCVCFFLLELKFARDILEEGSLRSSLPYLLFLSTILLYLIVLSCRMILWSSAKCEVVSEGLVVHYITGGKKFFRWAHVEDARISCVFTTDYHAYKCIRITTDKELDNKYSALIHKRNMRTYRDRSISFAMRHADKIVIFQYTQEAENQVRQFYPALRNSLSKAEEEYLC